MATPIAYTLMKSLALKFLLTDSFLAVIRFCRGLTHFGSVEVPLNPEMDFNGASELRKMSKETQWICCDNISPTTSSLQRPPRSPDLIPCDFFLWGYLKSLVHVDRLRNIAHLNSRTIFATPLATYLLKCCKEWIRISKIDFISVYAMGVAIYPMSFSCMSRLYEKKNRDILFSNKKKF